MSNAFDGAGKPYREPGYLVGLVMLLLLVLAVVALGLGASWALKEADQQGINTQVNELPLQSP